MKIVTHIFILITFVIISEKSFSKKIFIKKIQQHISMMEKWSNHKTVIEAVKKENNNKKNINEIKKLDLKWINSVGVPNFIKKFLNNKCAKYLKEMQKKEDWVAEIFVMDNQGAIVCATNKTSDYMQGDEAKWKKSYMPDRNGVGHGKIFIDKAKFDESTQAFLVQVSVPVITERGETIGVVTIGIDLDKLDVKK